VMNMAHSGGEDEAPMNTMYAFKRAATIGADMLELDVQSTKDGQLVVIHNATVDETTDGTGRVVDMTLDQLKELDAAYWFVPGRSTVHGLPDAAYTLRGARGTVTRRSPASSPATSRSRRCAKTSKPSPRPRSISRSRAPATPTSPPSIAPRACWRRC